MHALTQGNLQPPAAAIITPPQRTVSSLMLSLEINISQTVLQQEIQTEELALLAQYFVDHWKVFIYAFRLPPGDLSDIEVEAHQYGTSVAMIKCLRSWQKVNPSLATFENLLDVILKLNKKDVARKIGTYIVETYRR